MSREMYLVKEEIMGYDGKEMNAIWHTGSRYTSMLSVYEQH
jgi:hypothetical protein